MSKRKRASDRVFLDAFYPIVDLIADLFGPTCEVVLHDFSRPRATVVKIRNGHVTGRSRGSTITDLGLQTVHKLHNDPNTSPSLVNYYSHGANGRELKCGSMVIRTENGKCLGSLCINIDLTAYRLMLGVLDKFCETFPLRSVLESKPKATKSRKRKVKKGLGADNRVDEERFAHHFRELMADAMNTAIRESGAAPGLLTQKDRLSVLKTLEKRGVFLLRGAIPEVSRRLGLAESTVYRYLARERRNASRGYEEWK